MLGSISDSSPVVSRSLKGAGVNWGRLMKQGMMGRKERKETTGRRLVDPQVAQALWLPSI